MTKITGVTFETQMSPNGADIQIPKAALEALGLPTEYEEIQGNDVRINLTVFRTRDDQHLGTRDKLLYPARRVYWACTGRTKGRRDTTTNLSGSI